MQRALRTAAVVTAVAFGLAAPARANVCAFDPVPAASLLFPFVVFDYNQPADGVTTLLTVTNLSPEPQIVRVTLWSDTGVGLLNFNVVLSGYDVQVVDIRDILYYGTLPETGTAGDLDVGPNQAPGARGPVSHDNAPWVAVTPGRGSASLVDRCPPTSPAYPDYPPMPQSVLDQLRALLSASQSALHDHDDCAGTTAPVEPADWFQLRSTADPTWMYVTADVVWSCARSSQPDFEPGYWRAPAAGGQAQYQNVLMGDVSWVGGLSGGVDHAVQLEADPDLGRVAALDAGGAPISFYYRFSTGAGDGADNREPLPTAWALRYLGWYDSSSYTRIRVFKSPTFAAIPPDLLVTGDPLVPTSLTARDCLAYSYFSWDEDENVNTEPGCGWAGCPPYRGVNLFPLVTQEVSINQLDFVDSDGWALFVWPASNWPGSGQPLPDRYQTWMGVYYDAYGTTFSGATSALVAANANCFPDQVLPALGVDYDYVDEEGYVDPGTQRTEAESVDPPAPR
jgi:hypothetical protein